MMSLLIALFVGGALFLLGYAFTTASASSSQISLKEKLASLNVSNADALAREVFTPEAEPKVDLKKMLSNLTGQAYIEGVEKELAQADIPMRISEYFMLRIVLVAAGFAGTLFLTGNFSLALILGGVMMFVHVPVIKIKKSMRIAKFCDQLSEFLTLITNSLKAGQTFLQGVDIACKDSPTPIATEFKQLMKETNLGLPVEEAFNNMLIRVPSEDLKIVISAFSIQRKVGGNLADILKQVAEMIRQRIQIQGQIRVLTTQGKLSGAIVGALPVAVAFMVWVIDPNYMSKLWSTMIGYILLAIWFFMQMVGCFVIYKICDIEV
jgi:tight adherence protein B